MSNIRKAVAALAFVLLSGTARAQELGSLAGAFIGPIQHQVSTLAVNSPTTLVFTAADAGWCARVMARDARDFKAVAVNFSAVTTPGTVTLRIETVDANGKPSGTLYDANATKQFTPSVGWNVITFDSLPTTGLTAGNQYAVILIKDDAGTTCTLRSYIGNIDGNWPINVLTTASASTRSTYAETANSTPICYFQLEDNALVTLGCVPVATSGSTFILSSASRSFAQKVVLPVDVVIRGVRFPDNTSIGRTGTPPADLRMRILDSSNVAVSGTTVTIDKDTLTNVNARGLYIPLPPTTLAAGTYRIAFDSAGDGSNYFSGYYVTLADAAFQSSGFCYSESTNIDSTFTWTDTPTRMLPFGLELDSIPASSPNTIDPLTGTIPGL